MDNKTLYEERLNRIRKAVNLEPVDRVPVVFMGVAFSPRYMGVSMGDFCADPELALQTSLDSLDRQGIIPAAHLDRLPHGKQLRTAGAVTVRQRPGTAKGILFLTLEDESGMSQAIVMPDLLQEHRQLIVGSHGLVVEGELQKRDGTLSIKAEKLWPLPDVAEAPSHDFR